MALLVVASVSVSAENTIYLLGEVHDNQAALVHAMPSCEGADCMIQKAGGNGWEWSCYKPVIQTALILL